MQRATGMVIKGKEGLSEKKLCPAKQRLREKVIALYKYTMR